MKKKISLSLLIFGPYFNYGVEQEWLSRMQKNYGGDSIKFRAVQDAELQIYRKLEVE